MRPSISRPPAGRCAKHERREIRVVVAQLEAEPAAQHGVCLVGREHVVGERRALEVARRDALEGAGRLPVAEQFLCEPRHLVGIELADYHQVGAGGAEEIAVAGDRVLERRLAHPADALVDGRGVERVAFGIGVLHR